MSVIMKEQESTSIPKSELHGLHKLAAYFTLLFSWRNLLHRQALDQSDEVGASPDNHDAWESIAQTVVNDAIPDFERGNQEVNTFYRRVAKPASKEADAK